MILPVLDHYPMSVEGPVSVAFVCLGNICRSPMAEAVFKHVVESNNLQSHVSKIDSFGTAGYHVGETPDSRTVSTCEVHDVPIKHRAQHFTAEKFADFDYVLCMDHSNLKNLKRIEPQNSKATVSLFGEWREDKSFSRIVDDPYYGGSEGFEICYEQCVHFSEVFLRKELGANI